jgi:uncharacterized membrane protein YhaH (DUF805 family)
MRNLLHSLRHNLAGLARFSGRDDRATFWPYACVIVGLAIAAMMAIMLPAMADNMVKVQQFATAHPELATVQTGPGSYSVTIEGNHPELMPDMRPMIGGVASITTVAVLLLAAAVARRLHDRGVSALLALPTLLFLSVSCLLTPHVIASIPGDGMPAMGLLFALFVNNLLYLASLVGLVALLGGASRPQTR